MKITKNREQPGAQIGPRFELVDPLYRPCDAVLHQIVREIRIARKRERKPTQRRQMHFNLPDTLVHRLVPDPSPTQIFVCEEQKWGNGTRTAIYLCKTHGVNLFNL